MVERSQGGATTAAAGAPRVFVCSGCAQVLSFGKSECDGCGALYRYQAGRAVRADDPEAEQGASSTPAIAAFRAGSHGDEEVGELARRMRGPSPVAVGALITAMAFDVTTDTVLVISGAMPPEVNPFPFIAFGLLLWWMRSTNATLRRLGTEGLRYSPNGTVLFWFVPLANLISPYRAMRELWLATNPEKLEGWGRARATRLLPWWWAAFLASSISENLSAADLGVKVGRFALLSSVVSAVLSGWLYFGVHTRLTQKVQRLARW
jgi:hypothetical protein